MAEEHGYQSQEPQILCSNNCGFFGNPATLNLCPKCYRDTCLEENSAKIAFEKSLALPSPSLTVKDDEELLAPKSVVVLSTDPSSAASAQPRRCWTCRKKVGLVGFKCRCGITFCSMHRYPEKHGCSFDFKAVGKEAIARANPVVKGEKLQKI